MACNIVNPEPPLGALRAILSLRPGDGSNGFDHAVVVQEEMVLNPEPLLGVNKISGRRPGINDSGGYAGVHDQSHRHRPRAAIDDSAGYTAVFGGNIATKMAAAPPEICSHMRAWRSHVKLVDMVVHKSLGRIAVEHGKQAGLA